MMRSPSCARVIKLILVINSTNVYIILIKINTYLRSLFVLRETKNISITTYKKDVS